MNILVTGGAGFIGSNLVEKLVKEHPDATITVVDNFHTGSRENLKGAVDNFGDRIQIIEGAVEALHDIEELPEKIDQIYHLGIYSSSPMYKDDPQLTGKVTNGMIRILDLAKKHESPIVWASSSSVYNGVTPPHKEDAPIGVTDFYTEARYACERMALLYNQMHGVRSVGIRFFSVYGPHERFKKEFANIITQFFWEMEQGNAPVLYGDGTQIRDFTYVDDIVEGFWRAMQRDLGYEIINVGTSMTNNFNDVVAELNKQLGTNIKPQYVGNPIKNYVAETEASTEKLEHLLDFKPSITLAEGISKLIALPEDQR